MKLFRAKREVATRADYILEGWSYCFCTLRANPVGAIAVALHLI
jgi:hypothetical protein